MIIDLHNHTREGSPDGEISVKELFKLARKFGLDGVGITEHDSASSLSAARSASAETGVFHFQGIEVSTDKGHILVYGDQTSIFNSETPSIRTEILKEVVLQISDQYEWTSLSTLREALKPKIMTLWSAENLLSISESQGSVSILAHPFHELPRLKGLPSLFHTWEKENNNFYDMKSFLEFLRKSDPMFYLLLHQVDAIEVCNGCISVSENRLAFLLAKELGKPMVGGSDAHTEKYGGLCATKFYEKVENTTELVSSIKNGLVEPIYVGINPSFNSI